MPERPPARFPSCLPDCRASAPRRRAGAAVPDRMQRGAGMAGFLVALVPILGLGLGGVELAHWMNLRQTLSLALVDAARAGITRQARPQAIAEAFEQGLRMAYVQPAARDRALRERRRALGVPWRIRILSPVPAAFRDHADPELRQPGLPRGQALIRNDYQPLQQARRIAQGWPQGRGPQSGLDIHEANLLVLDLWWPERPLLPGTAAIVRGLAALHGDPVGREMMRQGYLPFRRRIRMPMQSHPAQWPDLADGRVTHGDAHRGPDTPAGDGGAGDPIPGAAPGADTGTGTGTGTTTVPESAGPDGPPGAGTGPGSGPVTRPEPETGAGPDKAPGDPAACGP